MTRLLVFAAARHSLRLPVTVLAALAMAAAILPTHAADAPKSISPRSVGPNPAAAMQTLTQQGLTKLKATPTSVPWVLADDAKVHDKLADFRKAEAAQRAAAKTAKEVSTQITKDREKLSKAETRYQELKGYADKPDTIPRQIAARFRSDLSAQVATINDLRPKLTGRFVGEMPPVLKAAIIDWMSARTKLIMAYPAAESDFSPLDKQYQKLADDPEVAAAFKTLGKKHRLGSPDFELDKRAIAAAEATVQSGEIPFYREGSFDFVGALLNETTPVVVKIESVNLQSANWASAEVLTKAGIVIDPAAPIVTVNMSGNGKRTILCRQVVVPKLRLGKYVLEDLKFLAMPDDAKDLGLQLMNSELKGYDQTPDLVTWLCKFVKQEQPKPDEKETAKPDGN